MISTFRLRIFEEFVLCKQTNARVFLAGNPSELSEMTVSYRLSRQVLNQPGVEEGISSFGNNLAVDVIGVDLNVNRKLNNCLHNFKRLKEEYVFVLLGLIRAAILATERPGTTPWELEGSNKNDSWT